MDSFSQKNNPRRQQLLPKDYDADLLEQEAIKAASHSHHKETIEDVRDHLQQAIELELSTIPPYLCALYSIKDGTNLEAAEIIKSVVIEEMLHMVMVANLLNAIGGTPKIGDKAFTPNYPTVLPGNVMPDLTVGLGYFSPDTIRVFEIIEHPDGAKKDDKKPAGPIGLQHGHDFDGIGDFYAAILADLQVLEHEKQKAGETIFTGTVQQVTNEHYYGAGGHIINVTCLEDAEKLIEEIVGQGEGTLGSIFVDEYDKDHASYQIFGQDIEEYAHYFRFKEVRFGRYYAPTDSAHRDSPNKGLPTGEKFDVDWDAVHKMRPNPSMSHYKKGSDVYNKSLEFNKTYMSLLKNLHDACNGNPDKLKEGIPLMYDLKYKAIELMNIPVGDGEVAGPSFEYVEC